MSSPKFPSATSLSNKPKKSSIKYKQPNVQGLEVFNNRQLFLYEDYFGTLTYSDGNVEQVKRYTWCNNNNLSVSVITYGARITSVKMPNKSGFVEEILLGFDDLAGYLYYDDLYVGAVIGRTSNRIRNGTYVVDNKQSWLTLNDGKHHFNGGGEGFDKVNWTPYVNGSQLILTYTSKDKEEGYPGDLFVKIIYELTMSNEFKMSVTANTSKVTIVDLSNKAFFNLGGHETGSNELKNHVVLLNANCHTPYADDGFPTGELLNVAYSRYDFQTPKLLKKIMGLDMKNGYDQNFCINKGVDQDNAFVARVTHPQSGRILEIYSNQFGVNFYTATRFPSGLINIKIGPQMSSFASVLNSNPGLSVLLVKLEEYMKNNLEFPDPEDTIKKMLKKLVFEDGLPDQDSEISNPNVVNSHVDLDSVVVLDPPALRLYNCVKNILPLIQDETTISQVRNMKATDIFHKDANILGDAEDTESDVYLQYVYDFIDKNRYKTEIVGEDRVCSQVWSETTDYDDKFANIKGNEIPKFYRDGRIHGRGGAIYRTNGAFCLQTQNYPNAVYCRKFPQPVLHPNETYVHNITYKFLIQTGHPLKWFKYMDMQYDPCVKK